MMGAILRRVVWNDGRYIKKGNSRWGLGREWQYLLLCLGEGE